MEDPGVMTAAPPLNKFSAFVETQSSSAFFLKGRNYNRIQDLATEESWFDARQG